MTWLNTIESIPAAFITTARTNPDLEVYRQAVHEPSTERTLSAKPRKWDSRTFRDVEFRISALARYLRRSGVQPGDRVAIISNSCPEWMESDLAILSCGAVTVHVYPSLTAQEIGYILFDASAQVVIVENNEQYEKVLWLQANDCEIPGTEDRAGTLARLSFRLVIAFDSVAPNTVASNAVASGPSSGAPHSCEVVHWDTVMSLPPEPLTIIEGNLRHELATLVYTSGTTGPPKGVEQTHGNHLSNVRQAAESGLFRLDSTIMVFLPLAHSFAKLMGYIGFLTTVRLLFPAVVDRKTSRPDPASWAKDIREGSANIVPTVPRLLEKMKAGIEEKIAKGGILGLLLKLTLWSGARVVAAREGRAVAGPHAHLLWLVTGFMRRKVRALLFGPHFHYAVAGGAKLPVDVTRFFQALDIEVLEGYGLTETCVATNVNRTGDVRVGTVGPVLAPDIEVRIAEDGEILFRGPNIARGYFQRKTATRQAWDDDGWFHTGDLGALDSDGFLSITGRKKELIVMANGKKVPPDTVEQKVKSSLYISQVVVCGEGKPYCVALVTLQEEMIRKWAARQGIPADTAWCRDPGVIALIEQEVERVNKTLASYETIKRIKILPEDFTVDNGFLTPTFKVRRPNIMKRYGDLVEELYKDPSGSR